MGDQDYRPIALQSSAFNVCMLLEQMTGCKFLIICRWAAYACYIQWDALSAGAWFAFVSKINSHQPRPCNTFYNGVSNMHANRCSCSRNIVVRNLKNAFSSIECMVRLNHCRICKYALISLSCSHLSSQHIPKQICRWKMLIRKHRSIIPLFEIENSFVRVLNVFDPKLGEGLILGLILLLLESP